LDITHAANLLNYFSVNDTGNTALIFLAIKPKSSEFARAPSPRFGPFGGWRLANDKMWEAETIMKNTSSKTKLPGKQGQHLHQIHGKELRLTSKHESETFANVAQRVSRGT